jgi:tetratricopeptide (TPR) repeat protein
MIQDLGIVYRESGRYARALEATQDALQRFRDTYEAPHPAISDALAYLAQTHREAGDVEAAAGAFRDALDMVRGLDGRETDAVDLLTELATLELDSGRPDEAEAYLNEARDLIGSDLPPGTSFQTRMDLQRARLRLARGDGEAALETVRSITPWYERQFAPGHHERAAVMGVEGEILVFLGRLDEAEPLLLESDATLAEGPASLRRASAARLEALLNASGQGG